MAKSKQRIQARELRGGGESIKVIAKLLKVSPGSASLWCRDIVLTKKQIIDLEKRARDPHYGRRLSYSLAQQRKRQEKTVRLREEGIKDVGKLRKRELFLTGIALYWAEGFKKDSQAGFASSDPAMIKFFIKWLEECCDYGVEDLIFRVTVNISHKNRIGEIEKHWSNIIGIPESSFQKPYYQNVKWKKVYENPSEYFGVLRVKVRKSTDFLRKIYGWMEGLRLQAA